MSVWNREEQLTIKAVMTPFPYSIGVDEPLAAAKQMMKEFDIRHLPVVERGRLVGVLTDRDVGLALDSSVTPSVEEERRVRDLCVFEAYVVGLNEPLEMVLTEMAARHIGSALVVKDGRLAGIFTVTDACRTFAECLRAIGGQGDGDEAA